MMKRRKNTITSKSLIPKDSIVEVLRILPAKSVLRFRCVSKSWNSIIADPLFARLHLKRSRLMLFYDYHIPFFKTADYEALKIGNSREAFVERSLPFTLNPTSILTIWGSCNGILCFGIGVKGVNLWNPTTNEVYYLPKPRDRKGWNAWFGFGWDKSVNDYKVVRVLYRNSPVRTEVEVLALKSKTWVKRVRGIDLSFAPQLNNIIYCNGALHWMASTLPSFIGRKELVARFDLADEKWQKLPFPLGLKPFRIGTIGVLGDHLCLCSYSGDSIADGPKYCMDMDVWVMKEYGVESSWTKFTTLVCFTAWSPDIFIQSYVPLSFTTDGGIIAKANGNCVVKSNTNSGRSTVLTVTEPRDIFEAVVYEETVVSLVALSNTTR